MGCTGSGCEVFETPVHEVTLKSFKMAKTEVTQAQWEAITGDKQGEFLNDNNPVEGVNWNDVQRFIDTLNKRTGKNYRLPTEAEWEYAARGGKQTKEYKYSGSNNVEEVAWYRNNNEYKTHFVGTKLPNELGIYDMSGNVWEWCSDWYGDYSASSQTNPTGPASGTVRICRGGSWIYNEGSCRVAGRGSFAPTYRSNDLGFRLVLPLP